MASVNKVILEDLYLHQKLSTTDIAKAIGVSASPYTCSGKSKEQTKEAKWPV